jgi:hypothetical protein
MNNMLNRRTSFPGSSNSTSTLLRMSSTRPRSFLSQLVLMINVIVLLITLVPCVSSSPTPMPMSHQDNNSNNHKMISGSSAFMLDPTTSDEDSSSSGSLPSSSVHRQVLSDLPSSFRYAQPRSHANQFLMSYLNDDNDVLVPKWFTRFNNDDMNGNDDDDDDNGNDDDNDDDISRDIFLSRRSSYASNGGYPMLKKRKQITKPPMEVMNEIVNSIYLKR